MGQYTSRINNPSTNTTTNNNSTAISPYQSPSQPSHQPAPNASSRITNLRRRRSSTNYTASHLPASRRRRLPRLNESIRFWNRRGTSSNNQSSESLVDQEEDEENDDDVDGVSHSSTIGNNGASIVPPTTSIPNIINELQSSTTPATTSPPMNPALAANPSTALDIAGLADLASDIFSSRSNHHSRPNLNQHSSFSSIPSASSNSSSVRHRGATTHSHDNLESYNNNNNSNAMSFEHQTEMLSRLLEIAATSTVMNLMGTAQVNGRRFDNTSRIQAAAAASSSTQNSSNSNGDDSNFQEFVSALRHGLLTNELSNRYSDADSNDRDNMTFFRAFRFDSENTATGTTPTSNNDNEWDFDADIGDGPFAFGLQEQEEELEQNDYANSSGNLPQNSNTGTTTNEADNNDVESPNVPVMIIGVRSVQQNGSESLNTLATGTTGSSGATTSTTTTPSTHISPNGSGPNPDTSSSQPSQPSHHHHHHQQPQQRSWVIFVMGNTFAWNHPLLSAPSLMSENPTYEDLLNLQELIGQVKPQVTTKEELYKHSDQLYEVELVKVNSSTNTTTDFKLLQVDQFERCQICLSEYEDHDIVRKLTSCNHFYHRDCVDNWLLNGKNNCPLCRSKGIVNPNGDEKEKEQQQEGANTAESVDVF